MERYVPLLYWICYRFCRFCRTRMQWSVTCPYCTGFATDSVDSVELDCNGALRALIVLDLLQILQILQNSNAMERYVPLLYWICYRFCRFCRTRMQWSVTCPYCTGFATDSVDSVELECNGALRALIVLDLLQILQILQNSNAMERYVPLLYWICYRFCRFCRTRLQWSVTCPYCTGFATDSVDSVELECNGALRALIALDLLQILQILQNSNAMERYVPLLYWICYRFCRFCRTRMQWSVTCPYCTGFATDSVDSVELECNGALRALIVLDLLQILQILQNSIAMERYVPLLYWICYRFCRFCRTRMQWSVTCPYCTGFATDSVDSVELDCNGALHALIVLDLLQILQILQNSIAMERYVPLLYWICYRFCRFCRTRLQWSVTCPYCTGFATDSVDSVELECNGALRALIVLDLLQILQILQNSIAMERYVPLLYWICYRFCRFCRTRMQWSVTCPYCTGFATDSVDSVELDCNGALRALIVLDLLQILQILQNSNAMERYVPLLYWICYRFCRFCRTRLQWSVTYPYCIFHSLFTYVSCLPIFFSWFVFVKQMTKIEIMLIFLWSKRPTDMKSSYYADGFLLLEKNG